MKTLDDVAKRLAGMAQNAADRAETHRYDTSFYRDERKRMVEFIDMATIINNHVAECPQCKQSQSP